jgi:predicted metal-dependent phosphoesterase TrpH
MEKNVKLVLLVFLIVFSVFAAPQFDGLEVDDVSDPLTQTIVQVEEKAEELTTVFTEEEAVALEEVVSDVKGLMDEQDVAMAFLNSDMQEKLIRLEEAWKRRDGARIVVKLLESIRIKAQLYIQNQVLIDKIEKGNSKEIAKDSEEHLKLKEMASRYLDGLELSNNTLSETVELGTQR